MIYIGKPSKPTAIDEIDWVPTLLLPAANIIHQGNIKKNIYKWFTLTQQYFFIDQNLQTDTPLPGTSSNADQPIIAGNLTSNKYRFFYS